MAVDVERRGVPQPGNINLQNPGELEFEVRLKQALESNDPVGMYMVEAAMTPLLTQEEEVVLFKRIVSGRVAGKKLAGSLNGKHLSNGDLLSLNSIIEDGKEAKDHVIQANLRLVISIAKRYMNGPLAFPDLIQEGNVGLERSTDKFDYKRGNRFSTYATSWVRQTINRAIVDKGRTIRIPTHIYDAVRRVRKTKRVLTNELGRDPIDEEIADATGFEVKKVRYINNIANIPVSLDAPIKNAEDDSEASLGDFVADTDSPSPEDVAEQRDLHQKLEEILQTFPLRERIILRLSFGYYGKNYNFVEVSRKFGLTRERIRQIVAKYLELALPLAEDKGLREHLT